MMKLLFLLLLPSAFAALTNIDNATFEYINLLNNPGFENGKDKWTTSSSVDDPYLVSSSAPGSGLRNITFDASASGKKLISNAVAIPAGLYGQLGVAKCNIKTPSGTATHTIGAFDGSNPVGTAQAVTSGTTYKRASENFTFPTSGNIQLQIIGQANEPLIHVDECYLGLRGTVASTNVVATTSSNVAVVAFQGSGTCVVTERTGDDINGNGSNSGTGLCTYTFNSGVFTATPACNCRSNNGTTNGAPCSGDITATSTTTVKTQTTNHSGTGEASIHDVICIGIR